MLIFDASDGGGLGLRSAGGNRAFFRTGGLHLVATGAEPITLGWEEFIPPRQRMRSRRASGWSVTFTNPANRYESDAGAAIRLHGALRSSGRAFRRKADPIERRIAMFSLLGGPHRIPLRVRGRRDGERWQPNTDRAGVEHLSWVLSARSDLRARLDVPTRIQQLAAELNDGLIMPPRDHAASGSKDSLNVQVAMKFCGFHHEFLRPLSVEEVCPLDEIVDPVLARLATSKDPRVRGLGRSWIEEVARVSYVDVEPWPFSSLVD